MDIYGSVDVNEKNPPKKICFQAWKFFFRSNLFLQKEKLICEKIIFMENFFFC